MSEQAKPPGPGAERPPGVSPPVPSSSSAPPLHLQYAPPDPPEPWGPDAPVLRVIRQIVFALGLALLLYGLTSALAGVDVHSAPGYAAWGAGFIGLATPLWRVTKDRD